MTDRRDETYPQGLAWLKHGASLIAIYSIIQVQGRLQCECGDPQCKSRGKHPNPRLCPNGLNSATRDPATLQRWLTACPDMNLAVVTGEPFANSNQILFGLDIDDRHDGDRSLNLLEGEHGTLPRTWAVITPGGEHRYYLTDHRLRNSAGRVAEGIDGRGVHGYMLVPPSLHITGRHYEWSVDGCPSETPLAALPQWIVAYLREPANGKTAGHWRKTTGLTVPEGQRNDTIARLSGVLFRAGHEERLVRELCAGWNLLRCNPPLDGDEVARTVASIAAAEKRKRGMADAA